MWKLEDGVRKKHMTLNGNPQLSVREVNRVRFGKMVTKLLRILWKNNWSLSLRENRKKVSCKMLQIDPRRLLKPSDV